MRAIHIRTFGGPDVLQVAEIPAPVPGNGEVLIEVNLAGVNFADIGRRQGRYGMSVDNLPSVPGVEVAGVRCDTGERVVARVPLGGYAQYAIAQDRLTFSVPDDVSDADALALFTPGLVAWHALTTCGNLQPGESVVVQAAAGGVGSVALQLARALGAGRVVGVVSGVERADAVLALGADAVVHPADEALGQRLVAANGGEKVDLVLEMTGGRVLHESLSALARFGRMVVYGHASGEETTIAIDPLLQQSQSVRGLWLAHFFDDPALMRSSVAALFERARSGALRAIVAPVYPLADAGRAHRDLEARSTVGKLVLDPSL